ncbi:MAG: HutD/Ves family protein [Gaiellales bacterium]
MAAATHLPAAGYTAMPWRNGAGTTHEIAIDETPGDSAAPFRWRLSMADLADDGPFSEIPDVDRVLVLLAGDDVRLAIDGAAPAPLGRHEAIAFPGDVPTSLTMAPGSGRDLNLMWDRTRARGTVEVVAAGDERTLDAPVAFAIALGGPATVAVDGDAHALGEQDALRVDGGRGLRVVAGDVYLATIR